MDLSQENVAEDLGMTKGAFSKIERGLTNIPVARLIEIAAVLKVDVGEFFEKENSKSKIEDHIPQYGFASKSDIEELVKMIQSLAKEVSVLKTTIDGMKVVTKTKSKK
jgi:transcriptional regulator with XRE-family HTH domain